MKKQDTINAMAARLAKTLKPKQIYLFGSYAWGKPRKDSDIDLCLVFQELKPQQVLPLMQQAHKELSDFGHAKDIIVKSSQRMESLRQFSAPLESQILQKGKLLYESL